MTEEKLLPSRIIFRLERKEVKMSDLKIGDIFVMRQRSGEEDGETDNHFFRATSEPFPTPEHLKDKIQGRGQFSVEAVRYCEDENYGGT